MKDNTILTDEEKEKIIESYRLKIIAPTSFNDPKFEAYSNARVYLGTVLNDLEQLLAKKMEERDKGTWEDLQEAFEIGMIVTLAQVRDNNKDIKDLKLIVVKDFSEIKELLSKYKH